MGSDIVKKRLTLDRLCLYLWAGVCAVLLILDLFFSKGYYYCKRPFASPFLLSFCSLSGVTLLFYLLHRRKIPSGLPLVLGLVAHLFQYWLVRQYYFLPGWDCGSLYNIAVNASHGAVNDPFNVVYLSAYPNNLLLAALMTKVFSLGWELEPLYALFHAVLCLISFFTGLLTFRLAEQVTGKRSIAFLVYILYLLLIGASPWVSVLYSDSVSLLFPVLLLSLYAAKPVRPAVKALKWFALGFSAFLGYSFKPTASFPFLAVMVLELVSSLSWSKAKQFLLRLGVAALGLLVAYGLVTFIITDFGCDLYPDLRLGPVHFFSMGLNERTSGVYAEEDIEFAASFKTVEERNAAELLQAKERIKTMGFKGLLEHGKKKLLVCFNDGSFAWGVDGSFSALVFETADKAALSIRSFYYKDGAHYGLFLNFMQALWLAVLFFNLFAAGGEPRKELTACLVTLFGLVLYLLLFEVRARYVYIFAPVFLVIASCGFSNIENHLTHNGKCRMSP